jgi:hypothetical protein
VDIKVSEESVASVFWIEMSWVRMQSSYMGRYSESWSFRPMGGIEEMKPSLTHQKSWWSNNDPFRATVDREM